MSSCDGTVAPHCFWPSRPDSSALPTPVSTAIASLDFGSASEVGTSVPAAVDAGERLRRCEDRLDALEAEMASSSAAVAGFAGQACQRIDAMETDITKLLQHQERRHSELDTKALHSMLAEAANGLVDDIRGSATRLLMNAGQELATAIEDGKKAAQSLARSIAEERAVKITECVDVRLAQFEAQRCRIESVADAGQGGTGSATMGLELLSDTESRGSSKAESVVEARMMERLVALMDVAKNPVNSFGMDALMRDMVESVEAVSFRVAALEVRSKSVSSLGCKVRSETATPAAATRLDVVEKDVTVLWAALREVSRDVVCKGVGATPVPDRASPNLAGGCQQVQYSQIPSLPTFQYGSMAPRG